MSRIYTASFDTTAVTAAEDFFTLISSSTTFVPIEIHSVTLSQKTLTSWEAKDITFKRLPGPVTTTGGTSVTPRLMDPNGSAAATSALINSTTLATSTGTTVTLYADDFNFLNGFYWSPAGNDDRIVINPGAAFVVRLGTAPSGSMTVSGTVTFAELC